MYNPSNKNNINEPAIARQLARWIRSPGKFEFQSIERNTNNHTSSSYINNSPTNEYSSENSHESGQSSYARDSKF